MLSGGGEGGRNRNDGAVIGQSVEQRGKKS